MTVPIPPIGASPIAATPGIDRPQVTRVGRDGDEGFGGQVLKALESVSEAEHRADAMVQDLATGGNTGIHEVMAAMTKASLGVEVLVQVRNRAIEAYQEIMRMQV